MLTEVVSHSPVAMLSGYVVRTYIYRGIPVIVVICHIWILTALGSADNTMAMAIQIQWHVESISV